MQIILVWNGWLDSSSLHDISMNLKHVLEKDYSSFLQTFSPTYLNSKALTRQQYYQTSLIHILSIQYRLVAKSIWQNMKYHWKSLGAAPAYPPSSFDIIILQNNLDTNDRFDWNIIIRYGWVIKRNRDFHSVKLKSN